MIKTFYQEDIINTLAAIFTYGLNQGYSYKSIEERFTVSSFVIALENNKYDIETKIQNVVGLTYGVRLFDKEVDISFKGLFYAESYFKLFLHFGKSFEYLFLYWPLSLFEERYGIYHEMDFSSLRNDFLSLTKETTLLKKLAKDRQLKLTEISKLTGINKNSIDKYSLDDKCLYEASYHTIYKLANLFGVRENIFASNLAVCLDQSIYLFDKSSQDYRNYLGLYFASYFDTRIQEKDFAYDKDDNCFISKNGIRLIVLADTLRNLPSGKLNEIADPKTYIVIIPSAFIGSKSDFDYLKDVAALDIFVLTQEYVYIVKKESAKEITDTVSRSLFIRAKEKTLNR